MTTIRIGIAGCGQIALGVHLPILLSTPHVKITALADTDQVKLRAAASLAPGAATFRQLIPEGMDGMPIPPMTRE